MADETKNDGKVSIPFNIVMGNTCTTSMVVDNGIAGTGIHDYRVVGNPDSPTYKDDCRRCSSLRSKS